MANRTYKVFGCAHDTSGSLNVVLSVGGAEVYNGAVSAETTPHTETPLAENELFSYELDEATSGNQSWSITTTGTDESSQLWIGPIKCNNVRPNMTMDLEYFTDRMAPIADPTSETFTADEQAHIANTLGETALGTTVYNKLLAGTSYPQDDAAVIMNANELEGKDADVWYVTGETKTNGQKDGEAYDVTPEGCWPGVNGGETLTMTIDLTAPVFAYDPPLPE